MKQHKSLNICLFGFLLLIWIPNKATAQQTDSEEQSWNLLVMPYGLVPSMHGTIGVLSLPDVEVDGSAKAIIRNLKFGALLYAEASNENWAISSDLIYLKLGKDTRTGEIVRDGNLEIKQHAWEIGVLRKAFSCLELGAGARYNKMETGIDLTINTPQGSFPSSAQVSVSWFDPIIISRIKGSPTDNLILQLRADIGGFGVGSNFAWQGQAYADYKLSDLFQMGIGYCYISVDYKEGSDDNRFLFDVNTKGPAFRFGFNF